jgi:alpha-tubulin suppressor-like RCC1 family protein
MTSLSAGYYHACGVTTSGVVQCWGDNSSGELGDNTTTSRAVPAPIASSLAFTSVAAGGAHTCAVAAGGVVYCWGFSANGRLGDGGQASIGTQPVKVAGALSFASIAAGGSHTCGVTTSGDAYCWGLNASGQLGDNSVIDRSTPVAVAGGFKFTSVSAGDSHSCGIVVGGAAYCWGDNTYGQLGDGTFAAQKTPTLVPGGMSFVALSAGGFHTCGIASGGRASCWGDNSTGELGNASVGGLLFKSISAGGVVVGSGGGGCDYYGYCSPDYAIIEGHTCGVTTAGVTYCWGSNDRGELGYGPTLGSSAQPLKVGGQP